MMQNNNSKVVLLLSIFITRIAQFAVAIGFYNDIIVNRTAEISSLPLEKDTESSRCPLQCQNGGSCVMKKTMRTTSNPMERELQGEWECDCPQEYEGLLCEKRRRKLQTTTCGNMECQNNGQCAPGQSYESPNALCDCSTAIEVVGTAPNFGLARYVGKYCEIEVKANDFCSRDIDMFCVNDGLCRVQAINFVDEPCDCSDDYTGRHCEYRTEHVQQECSLSCSGAGTCQHGINPNDDSGANAALDLGDDATNNFMHCICDEGHAGSNCEYEYMKCGGENRYCYHGSTCVAEGAGTGEVCECTNENGVKLAGDFCEFKATDHCENPTPIDEVSALQLFEPLNKMTTAEIPFCVNNGVCYKVAGADDHYCSCDSRTWGGKRCEVKSVGETIGYTAQPTVQGTGYPGQVPSPLIISPSPSPSPVPSPAPTDPGKTQPAKDSGATVESNQGMSAGGKFGIVLVVFGGIAFITVMAIYFHQRAYFIERVVYQGSHSRDSVYRDNHQFHDPHFAPPESQFMPNDHKQFGPPPPDHRNSHYPLPPERQPQYPLPPERQQHYPLPPERQAHYPLPPERQPHYPPPPNGAEMEMTPTHYGDMGEQRPNSLHRLNGMLNGGRQKHSYTPAPSSEERDFANVELV